MPSLDFSEQVPTVRRQSRWYHNPLAFMVCTALAVAIGVYVGHLAFTATVYAYVQIKVAEFQREWQKTLQELEDRARERAPRR